MLQKSDSMLSDCNAQVIALQQSLKDHEKAESNLIGANEKASEMLEQKDTQLQVRDDQLALAGKQIKKGSFKNKLLSAGTGTGAAAAVVFAIILLVK